ncbi:MULTISPECIES: winged helix-turn-helix transcriptional regulator [Pedobacter]|jgi:DNA-binding HxlR family transcriptional regulator|uniref:winged helix-turn-helix transcriptional regulator n=1 Tax=Pedobacter TaxID=84567 RepID=UPI00106205A7|nr:MULTISPECIES: helix-turn-helix domain-containing protein [Pedobacter]HWW41221.1 helix-turn-helix domain-containing protein [Pedobacter sp.]
MSDFKELIDRDKVQQCPRHYVLALTDTLNVMNGKWKLPIIASLLHGKTRFKDLQDNIDKITPRMLSKELKELEINGIVERKVYNQTPVLIEYILTESGKSITSVIDSMIDWGMLHRTETIKSRWP